MNYLTWGDASPAGVSPEDDQRHGAALLGGRAGELGLLSLEKLWGDLTVV